MTTLRTITTIELSNDCQLACRYCVNRDMEKKAHRRRQIMSDEVFEKCLDLLTDLCTRNTQAEVNMNGNGESFLDPKMFSRIAAVRNVIGKDRLLNISTNGLIMSDEIAQALKHSGLDQMQVSVHRPEVARLAGQTLAINGMKGSFNFGAVSAPHNWAGQIAKEHWVRVLPKIPCHPLMEGRGYVSVEGNISPCCYDYRLLGAFGTVFDSDLVQREVKPFSLCETCHQEIPEEIAREYNVQQIKRMDFATCTLQP